VCKNAGLGAPASISSQHMPTAVGKYRSAPNQHTSPLKYSYFSAATSSQKNKEKQVYNYHLFLNYDPPNGAGNMFCLALITVH
jgi:hypothetical protein